MTTQYNNDNNTMIQYGSSLTFVVDTRLLVNTRRM